MLITGEHLVILNCQDNPWVLLKHVKMAADLVWEFNVDGTAEVSADWISI